MNTWLHALMKQYNIPLESYSELKSILTNKTTDAAEKCELLLEYLNEFIQLNSIESFVRLTLDTLDRKSIESLLNPEKYSQELGVKLKKSKKELPDTKSLQDTIEQHIKSLNLTEDDDENDQIETLDYNALTPIQLLQSLFTDISQNEIEQALEFHNYNIESTMDTLFNQDESALEEEQQPSKQVCRHFLLGQCYRADCWFSHDPDALLCKFWLRGRCYKGDECEFSHGQALEQIVVPQKPIPEIQQRPPAMDDFPALGSVAKKKFDFLAPTTPYTDMVKKAPVAPTKLEQAYNTQQSSKAVKDIHTKWVSTGQQLSNTYMNHRSEAIDAALTRNKLFQRATEAYLSGNKAAARALSLQAHQINNQVSYLHHEAATKIFQERNKHLYSTNGDPVIDLHGLHPDEAIDLLDDTLSTLRAKRHKGRVVIITGTGHHSRGVSKVLPIVRSHLTRGGWKPKDGTLADGRGGMLLINI